MNMGDEKVDEEEIMKQGKPAAQLQDPIPMEGKCATGMRTARGKGGDRAKKVRRWG